MTSETSEVRGDGPARRRASRARVALDAVAAVAAIAFAPIHWLSGPLLRFERRIPPDLRLAAIPFGMFVLLFGMISWSSHMDDKTEGGPGARATLAHDVALLRDGGVENCVLGAGTVIREVSRTGQTVRVTPVARPGSDHAGDCGPGDVGLMDRRDWFELRLFGSRKPD